MSSFAVLLLCIQACLVQNVFSQACLGASSSLSSAFASPMLAGPYGVNTPSFDYDGLAYPAAGCGAGLAPYGGAGEGNVVVANELRIAGNTAATGQVPIMGAVSFGGPVDAAGAVSISGTCACACGALY